MPRERIVGGTITIESDSGQTGVTGTSALDVSWGKDQQYVQLVAVLVTDDGETLPLPAGTHVTLGSWAQHTRLIKALRRARDDAHGSPE